MLNGLPIIHTHYDMEVIIDAVIDIFVRKQTRRFQFAYIVSN